MSVVRGVIVVEHAPGMLVSDRVLVELHILCAVLSTLDDIQVRVWNVAHIWAVVFVIDSIIDGRCQNHTT